MLYCSEDTQAEVGKKPKEQKENEEGEEVVMGSPLLQVAELLKALQHPTADGRVVVMASSMPGSSSIKYMLLNPASHFTDVTQCRQATVPSQSLSSAAATGLLSLTPSFYSNPSKFQTPSRGLP